MVVQMMSVGEDTGALDEMLHKISEFYDQEVEATTEALTSLIEPLMIAVMGVVIGSMIIALVHAHLQGLRPHPVDDERRPRIAQRRAEPEGVRRAGQQADR